MIICRAVTWQRWGCGAGEERSHLCERKAHSVVIIMTIVCISVFNFCFDVIRVDLALDRDQAKRLDESKSAHGARMPVCSLTIVCIYH